MEQAGPSWQRSVHTNRAFVWLRTGVLAVISLLPDASLLVLTQSSDLGHSYTPRDTSDGRTDNKAQEDSLSQVSRFGWK